jgi:hypothetical protein
MRIAFVNARGFRLAVAGSVVREARFETDSRIARHFLDILACAELARVNFVQARVMDFETETGHRRRQRPPDLSQDSRRVPRRIL